MGAYALLIGISEFNDPRLQKLNAPKSDVEAFGAVLKDQKRGGFDKVDTCIDQDPQTIRDRLAELLDDRTPNDMVLLYYSGHGIISRGQRLFLATGGTDFDRPQARSLSSAEIRDLLDQSRAGKQVVILDCCHSGAFADGAKGVAQTVTADTFGDDNAEGQYVLTATDALQFAYDATGALRASSPEPALSRFTGWLVDAIGNAKAAPDKDRITLDAVFNYLTQRARQESAGMTPKRFVGRNSGDIVIARNPAAQPVALPAELIAKLDDKDWQARRDAVLQLAKLADQASLRDLIEQAITDRISQERDYDVRAAMVSLLRNLGRTDTPPIGTPKEPVTVSPLGDSKSASAQAAPWAAALTRFWPKSKRDFAVRAALGAVGMVIGVGLIYWEDLPDRNITVPTPVRITAPDVLGDLSIGGLDLSANSASNISPNASANLSKDSQDSGTTANAQSGNIADPLPDIGPPSKLAGEAASSANQPPAVEPRKTAEPSKIAPPPGKLASLNSSKARNDLLDFTRDRRARDNPGTEFSDCTNCPVMISVPAGTFMMGSVPRTGLDALFGSDSRDEQPAHNVTIASPFAVGKFEVSFAEWDACVADHGCNGYRPPDEGWGRGNHPVVNVSWNDAQTYIAWLRAKTGKPYRLLSEAEWEYAARGATVSDFYWGATENRAFGKYNSSDGTAPVGSYRSNPFGLYDMAGNVNEWIADCNNDSYNGAPPDGSPWMTGKCSLHGIRGGSWTSPAANLRSANRDWDASGFRVNRNGFRIARGL